MNKDVQISLQERFLLLLHTHSELEIVDGKAILFLTFWGISYWVTTPHLVHKDSNFFTSLPAFVICVHVGVFVVAALMGLSYSTVVLVCIFLMISNLKNLYMFIDYSDISFGEVFIKSFVQFQINLLGSYWLSILGGLYIF